MTASRKPLKRRLRIRSRRTVSPTTNAPHDAPLLQLHAHWSMPAHPRYLEAANFHWPH